MCYGSTSCPNGGTCSLPNRCSCRPGFGGSHCQDINECLVSKGGCSQICRNSIGSYQCYCKNGYYLGSDRKTCLDINECLDTTCLNNGSCLNYAGSYACQCNQGFSGDVCQADINECLLSNDTCDDQCFNTNGSFYCKCNGDSSSLSEDGVSCKVNFKEKSYNSVAVGIGTGLSLAVSVVVVVFLTVLKMRHKRPSTLEETNHTSNGYQSQIWNSGVRTIYTGLSGNYDNAPIPAETENNRSMNEYEAVVVTQAVRVNDETERQISPYDNIQIEGIIDDSEQHRPDRETAEYENLVIFRK
ncbi:uncharacterized protein LOC143057079 [Mytilus galloprovincialis]|uniref:uncharacterized protein LOC143057079 n=1 Tax=Mytilus galloprovincialis TaxID=29158 RepID=UPI003F7C0069